MRRSSSSSIRWNEKARAKKELEQLYPLARFAPPNIYFDYINSLAVQFGEVGRLEEARNVSASVVAFPFAPHYPETIELLAIILRVVLKDRTTKEEINKICNTFFFALKNLFEDE